MFLSQMALDMGHEETQNLIRSPLLQRSMIYDAFPPASGHILWRIDTMDGRLWTTILSRLRPDLNQFHQSCGYSGVFPSWHIVDYDSILENLNLCTPKDFLLCASPSAPVNAPRDYLQDLSSLHHWLAEQGKNGGFELLSISSLTSFWKVIDSQYILYVWWEGTLQITNLELFADCTKSGFGYNLDLGAGLLTLSSSEGFWDF